MNFLSFKHWIHSNFCLLWLFSSAKRKVVLCFVLFITIVSLLSAWSLIRYKLFHNYWNWNFHLFCLLPIYSMRYFQPMIWICQWWYRQPHGEMRKWIFGETLLRWLEKTSSWQKSKLSREHLGREQRFSLGKVGKGYTVCKQLFSERAKRFPTTLR